MRGGRKEMSNDGTGAGARKEKDPRSNKRAMHFIDSSPIQATSTLVKSRQQESKCVDLPFFGAYAFQRIADSSVVASIGVSLHSVGLHAYERHIKRCPDAYRQCTPHNT